MMALGVALIALAFVLVLAEAHLSTGGLLPRPGRQPRSAVSRCY
jgi:hypothetical protein